jgi:hypothetical protein
LRWRGVLVLLCSRHLGAAAGLAAGQLLVSIWFVSCWERESCLWGVRDGLTSLTGIVVQGVCFIGILEKKRLVVEEAPRNDRWYTSFVCVHALVLRFGLYDVIAGRGMRLG